MYATSEVDFHIHLSKANINNSFQKGLPYVFFLSFMFFFFSSKLSSYTTHSYFGGSSSGIEKRRNPSNNSSCMVKMARTDIRLHEETSLKNPAQ